MRILLLWQYDSRYLRQFYLRNPGADRLSFCDQKRLLLEDGATWPFYLIPQFRRLGHEADMLPGNAEPALAMWAQENGMGRSASNWDVLRQQIREYRPDILWFSGHAEFVGGFVRSVRNYCGSAIGWCADAGGKHLDWAGVDGVLSSHANFVSMFRAMGLRSELVLPCVDTELVAACRSAEPQRSRDVVFYGTLSVIAFRKRLDFLAKVANRVHCEIHSDRIRWQRRPSPISTFLNQFRYIPFRIRNRFDSPVFGRDVLRLNASSKIILNAHVDSANGLAGNIRMFEVTAMGALLMTDASPNVAGLFQPGSEIVTYEHAADAVDKLRYYLSRPEELKAIANAGQQRTLRCHNSRVRAGEVLRIFEEIGGS